jgi:hypothetical protein
VKVFGSIEALPCLDKAPFFSLKTMKKALLLFFSSLALPLFGAAADRGQAPVNDSVILTRVSLSRLELAAPLSASAGLLPEKKERLPLSVQLYLKPSGQLNSMSAAVQKAAQKLRRQLAPGAKQKDRLRDSVVLAGAVWAYLNEVLPVDPAVDPGIQPRTDWRLAWPSAGEILSSGKADADGRAMVEVALLRALRVPARVAWARGHLAAQYWVALPPAALKAAEKALPKGKKTGKSRTKKGSAPKPPLGYWALLDPRLQDAEIEAWSLDNGVLKRLHWTPEQELSVQRLSWHRKIYAASESLTAKADLALLASAGRWMPDPLSPTPQPDLSVAGRFYVLTQESFRLECQGAMAPAEAVDLLSPYRPQLPQWGREVAPRVTALELEAQALWSDRPDRLRLRSGNKLRDEWQSPPPALGVLHYLSFGLRRPNSVLQATRSAGEVSGVFLRADNLTPRSGWVLQLAPQGVSTPSQTLTLGEDAHFSLSLTAQEQAQPLLELRSEAEQGVRLRGDLQILPIP